MRVYLDRGVGTFDHVSADGLDGDDVEGVLVAPLEHLPELPVADFLFQNVLINHLWHRWKVKYVNNTDNKIHSLPCLSVSCSSLSSTQPPPPATPATSTTLSSTSA